MKAIFTSATLLIAFAFTATAAQAQVFKTQVGGYYPAVGYRYHASTAAEGYLRGWAELHRGVGAYNLLNSQANINYQEAYRQALDNQLKATETYFAQRAINREARAIEAGPKPTPQELANLAKVRAPERLTVNEYRPSVGKVYWPATFDGAEFAAEREAIDHLVSARALTDAGLGSENSQQLVALGKDLEAKLKANIRELSPAEYVAAKKFVKSLQYEAQFETIPEGLALR